MVRAPRLPPAYSTPSCKLGKGPIPLGDTPAPKHTTGRMEGGLNLRLHKQPLLSTLAESTVCTALWNSPVASNTRQHVITLGYVLQKQVYPFREEEGWESSGKKRIEHLSGLLEG